MVRKFVIRGCDFTFKEHKALQEVLSAASDFEDPSIDKSIGIVDLALERCKRKVGRR